MITNDIIGRYVELRSAKVEDAEFALNIRHTPKAMKFMPSLDITLEQQKSWIEKQRITEGDYFFIVFNKNNERIGVNSVYDIHDEQGEIGRWVMQGGAFESIESKLLITQFSFNILKLKRLVEYSYPENISTLKASKIFGCKINKIIHDEERNLDFQNLILELEDFKLTEPQIMEILYNR